MKKIENKNNIIYRFFMSDMVEGFFFSALLATICTAAICSNMLNLSYKYLPSQIDKSLHVDYNWVFWAGMVIVLFYIIRDYVIPRRPFEFDFALVVLLQTLVFVGVIAFHNEDYSNIAYSWILPVAYFAGKVVVGRNKETANSRITVTIYAFMIALFIIAMLDFHKFFIHSILYGWYLTERWPGFWTGEIQNRCGMSLGLFLVNSSVWFALIRRKKQPTMVVVFLFMMILSEYWAHMVQSRTIMILPLLSLIVVLIIAVYDGRRIIPIWVWRIFFALIIGGACFAYLIVKNNWFNFEVFYDNSTWGREFIQNVRFIRALNGFKLMLKNPYGKLLEPENVLDNPHNTFLQYGRVNGISVFVLIELFRIITLKDAIIMAKTKNSSSWIKYLLIPAFVCFNVNFSMDPNGYVQRELWMMVLLINGMIRGWNEIYCETK